MKKFLSLLLVAIMLLSTFAFTSCDLFGTDSTTTTTTVQEEEQPKDARTTITEEEWNKVATLTNYTYIHTEPERDSYMPVTIEATDKLVNIYYKGEKVVVDLENQMLFNLTPLGWLGFSYANTYMSTTLSFVLGDRYYFQIPEFSSLEYDEETKTYTYVEENKNYFGNEVVSRRVCEYKFEDGTLVYSKQEFESLTYPENSYSLELKNVGTTSASNVSEYINVGDGKPEVNIVDNSVRTTITLEEWNDNVAINNATMKMATTIVYDSGYSSQTYKITENATETIRIDVGNEYKDLKIIIDGVYYTIIEKDGKIYARKTNRTVGPNGNTLWGDLAEQLSFEDFTYNEEGRYYSYSIEGVDVVSFYFENGVITKMVMIQGVGVDSENNPRYVEAICYFSDIGTTTIDIPEYEIEPEELKFELNDEGTGYVVKGMGTYREAEVIIPSEYKGLPVVAIGSSAFWDGTQITSVVIPDTVTTIGEYAFTYCENLVSVIIPSSVIEIESSAFSNCISLQSIVIPSSVEIMGRTVFKYCPNINIYCEAQSSAETWQEGWNLIDYDDNGPVYASSIVWGYVAE